MMAKRRRRLKSDPDVTKALTEMLRVAVSIQGTLNTVDSEEIQKKVGLQDCLDTAIDELADVLDLITNMAVYGAKKAGMSFDEYSALLRKVHEEMEAEIKAAVAEQYKSSKVAIYSDRGGNA